MSFSLTDAFQVGGASATVMGVMFGVYKLITLIINRRCRSDCCGRWFSLGIAVEATTPLSHRHATVEVTTLNHRLLGENLVEGKRGENQSGFALEPLTLSSGQSTSAEEHKSHPSVAVEGRNTPAPSYQSTVQSTHI